MDIDVSVDAFWKNRIVWSLMQPDLNFLFPYIEFESNKYLLYHIEIEHIEDTDMLLNLFPPTLFR